MEMSREDYENVCFNMFVLSIFKDYDVDKINITTRELSDGCKNYYNLMWFILKRMNDKQLEDYYNYISMFGRKVGFLR